MKIRSWALIALASATILTGCMPGKKVPVNGVYGRRVWYKPMTDSLGNYHPGHWRYYSQPWGYEHYYGNWYRDDPNWNKGQWKDGYHRYAKKYDKTRADRELIAPYK
ncbi:MAG: hypothetical protein K0U29_04260 [Gammaproteobacteria bacterium]|nr:hypothetical protein [Gammaproteobacteria bacterium]